MNVREARRLGKQAGEAAASWVFDGNTTKATYQNVKQGFDDGDPEVLDRLAPPNWLSGEWAGESIPEILGRAVTDVHMTAYETAAEEAYWRMVERDARRGAK